MANLTTIASALRLQLDNKISQRATTYRLKLSLERKLGDLPKLKVYPHAMPLPLSRLITEQPTSHSLPLPLNRKLRERDDSIIISPIDPTEPTGPVEKRRMNGAFVYVEPKISDCQSITLHQNSHNTQNLINYFYQNNLTKLVNISNNIHMQTLAFIPLVNDYHTIYSNNILIRFWQNHCFINLTAIHQPVVNKISKTISYISLNKFYNAKVIDYNNYINLRLQSIINHCHIATNGTNNQFIDNCQTNNISSAVPVPCRYYPIADVTLPDFSANVCRIRPPSNKLPLMLSRKHTGFLSSALPVMLQCWHDNAPRIVPNLRSYLVKNTIIANIAGIHFDIVSFSIKADMNGYCWQGNIELTANQYAKIKSKLDVERGNEPIINVSINGFMFSFIAEEVSRSRVFVNHSYSLGGRSMTARLGADYAKAQTGLLNQDNYASQIVNQQLVNLPFNIDRFEIDDWLIPANSYSVTNKTPIAVIADIANACGGFVTSHANLPKLSLKKRWKINAWELATANPDVVLPIDVIKSINDQKRANPRYNTVTLIGQTQAGEVYRGREGRERIAPIDNNALFTDRNCIISAGQAILSDSGIHANYTLVTRWTDKYNAPLAELGQIWQINDPEGAFKGVVTSVAVDVKLENDAPTVWQTVQLDRYLDV